MIHDQTSSFVAPSELANGSAASPTSLAALSDALRGLFIARPRLRLVRRLAFARTAAAPRLVLLDALPGNLDRSGTEASRG